MMTTSTQRMRTHIMRKAFIKARVMDCRMSSRYMRLSAPLVSGKPEPDRKNDIGDVVVILWRAAGLVSW
jgi:hypothetical protein